MPIITLVISFFIAMFFIVMIQIHIFEVAFAKLGLTPEASLLLLIGTLVGSGINLPLFTQHAKQLGHLVMSRDKKPVWEIYQPAKEGKVVIAVNVGGCVIPVCLCLYFISLSVVPPGVLLIALLAIIALSYNLSRIIPGMGVGMPIFIAPLAAAAIAIMLDPAHAAQLAYISGVLGVLIGADILRLKNIVELGAPVAVIGGAGTFDGIFMTGIIAVLLA